MTTRRTLATAQPEVNRWRALDRRVRTKLLVRTTGVRLRALREINRRSTRSVLGDADVAVSLTTHGERIERVFYAIESIANGRVRPRELVLWLDDGTPADSLPESLLALQRRGLTIGHSANFGPHTKYFPYVMGHETHTRPLVTADDDILYPRDWLSSLLRVAKRRRATAPGAREVVCHRARRITWDGDRLASYQQWAVTVGTEPTLLNFATGVGGVLYPAPLLAELRAAGQGFAGLCDRADDVWLHAVAVRTGYRAVQVRPVSRHLPSVPGSLDSGLWSGNVRQGGNDDAIAATYTDEDLAVLRAERDRLADGASALRPASAPGRRD